MNYKTFKWNILSVTVLSVVLTIFIIHPGYSQNSQKDTAKGEKRYRITAKIIEDNNGKKQEFDTTINMNRPMNPGDEKEMMRDFERRFRDLGDQMKEMEEEMQENREAFSVPDSGMTDSIRNYTQRIIKDWNGPRSPHFRQSMRPHAFDYNFNFDMPEVPEPPMPPLNGDRDEDTPRQFNFRDLRPSQEGSTLNDVIGNIPMDQVESYSIRETKHGKRITIELKNDPIIRQQENVIILREPKHPDRRGTAPRPEIRKRIIIKSAPDDKDNPGKL